MFLDKGRIRSGSALKSRYGLFPGEIDAKMPLRIKRQSKLKGWLQLLPSRSFNGYAVACSAATPRKPERSCCGVGGVAWPIPPPGDYCSWASTNTNFVLRYPGRHVKKCNALLGDVIR